MSYERERQRGLDLGSLEEPLAHKITVDVEDDEEDYAFPHEDYVERDRYCLHDDACDHNVFLIDPSRRQGPVREELLISLKILEVICDTEPEEECKNSPCSDEFLNADIETGNAQVQKYYEMDLQE